jgi:hypothetical protein
MKENRMHRPLLGRHGSLVCLLALLVLGAAPARADEPIRYERIQPWSLQFGASWNKEVNAGAPDGFLGGQVALHKGLFHPRLQFGVGVAYQGLGEVTGHNMDGTTWRSDFATMPIYGQFTYDFAAAGNTAFQASGGYGSFSKFLSGDDDCDCTDSAFNFGLGLRTRYPGGRWNFGGEIRYFLQPREDNTGNKVLSVGANIYHDFLSGGGRF